MQFEKCLTCPAIKEKRCSGPRFMRVPTKELIEWLIAYQKLNGITNAHLAEHSNIPKGTIDGLKNRTDVRHETFYPLLRSVIEMTGGTWDAESCPIDYAAANKSERLEKELEYTQTLLEQSTRLVKERTRAVYALFGLCVGLVVLLILMSL